MIRNLGFPSRDKLDAVQRCTLLQQKNLYVAGTGLLNMI